MASVRARYSGRAAGANAARATTGKSGGKVRQSSAERQPTRTKKGPTMNGRPVGPFDCIPKRGPEKREKMNRALLLSPARGLGEGVKKTQPASNRVATEPGCSIRPAQARKTPKKNGLRIKILTRRGGTRIVSPACTACASGSSATKFFFPQYALGGPDHEEPRPVPMNRSTSRPIPSSA